MADLVEQERSRISRRSGLYEDDFFAWTREQAAALRGLAAERWNGPLDLEHLAEEIEDMGSEQLNAVRSHLTRVIEHLLKLEYSPAAEPRRLWLISVRDGRRQVSRRMTRTIRNTIEDELTELFADGLHAAYHSLMQHHEVEAARALPPECPYTLDQLLDIAWLPANRHGQVEDD